MSAAPDAARRKYRYGARIGGGGMADVFRGTVVGAEGFERPIAIKKMLPSISDDPRFAEMFANEARIAAMLRHPNIVQVIDFDRDDDGRLFLVMELVDGVDLASLMRAGPVPLGVAVHLAREVLAALEHAHGAIGVDGAPLRIVHRDVSPQNVLLTRDGEVKLTDFGIAKAFGVAAAATTEVVRGKPLYMAPEQVTNPNKVDHRADLFAVGAILYEMASGQRIYAGATADEIFADVVQVARGHRDVPSIGSVVPDIDPRFEGVISRLLVREASGRFASASEAREALDGLTDVDARGLASLVRGGQART